MKKTKKPTPKAKPAKEKPAPKAKPAKATARAKKTTTWTNESVPPEALATFEAVASAMIAAGEADRSKMFASEGLRVARPGGKYFAMLSRGKLVCKMPAHRVAALVADGTGAYFQPMPGRLMKEWIEFAPGSGDWPSLIREAHAFVGGQV